MSRIALAFAFGLALGAANDAYAVSGFSADGFVSKIEAMLQVKPGAIKIVPQIASTFEYLGTKSLPNKVYAVYIKKLSGE